MTDNDVQQETPERTKRLTIDISPTLHKAIKQRALDDDVTMADQLREVLAAYYLPKS